MSQQTQFQQEPLGPQPTTPSKNQQQAQQLAAFLNKIPKPSTSAAPPRPPSPLLSHQMNGQDKSGLNSMSAKNDSSFMSRQHNFPARPMPSQGSCDIPNSTSRMPMTNERLQAAPQPPARGRSPAKPLQPSGNIGMAEATGGYNYNRIMEDHFDHYKRPASRERSVDKLNMPNALPEAPSKTFGRPSSRARTPTVSSIAPKVSSSRTDLDLDKRLEVRDDSKTNGGPPNLQGGNLKNHVPSQEVAHLGTVPKRTESMYFKPLVDEDSSARVSMQIKLHSLRSNGFVFN